MSANSPTRGGLPDVVFLIVIGGVFDLIDNSGAPRSGKTKPGLTVNEFSFQGSVVGLRAVVLQLPGDLGLLCLLTAASHGLDPLHLGAGVTSFENVVQPGKLVCVPEQRYRLCAV